MERGHRRLTGPRSRCAGLRWGYGRAGLTGPRPRCAGLRWGYGRAGLTAALACGLAAGGALAAEFPAARLDGEAPGAGSQKLMVDAVRRAHMFFSGDACLAELSATLFRTVDPKRPAEDEFDFVLRSPTLHKLRYEAKICMPYASGAAPQCAAEWEFLQRPIADAPRCLSIHPIDTAEALLSARKHGLPKAPADGMRLSLRTVAKKGRGLAKTPKLRGKAVWVLESRDECHVVDAKTADYLLKASCKSLGMAE